MKNKLISLTLLITLISGCNKSSSNINSSENKDDYKLKIISPTGAPAVGLLNYLNDKNYETNTVPNNIVAEMIKGTHDVVIVDLIGGLTAINKKSAQYKLASIITFGNFYIYSTGNDLNNIMESDDNIVCFGQNNTPDILFNHLYPNIGVDTYVAGVSDIAPIAMSGKINNENVDYCIIAEPVLFNVLNNKNALTYGKGSEYSNFQAKWKEIHGNESSILGASIYIKNETYQNHSNVVNSFLDNIKSDINTFVNNPEKAIELLDNYGSKEEQAQRIGLNSTIIKGVLEDSNSINLGYLSSKDSSFNSTVEEYLNVVNSTLINKNNYL